MIFVFPRSNISSRVGTLLTKPATRRRQPIMLRTLCPIIWLRHESRAEIAITMVQPRRRLQTDSVHPSDEHLTTGESTGNGIFFCHRPFSLALSLSPSLSLSLSLPVLSLFLFLCSRDKSDGTPGPLAPHKHSTRRNTLFPHHHAADAADVEFTGPHPDTRRETLKNPQSNWPSLKLLSIFAVGLARL